MKFNIPDGEYAGSYELDERSMTFGEARAYERTTGHPITNMDKAGLTGTQAMLWIAMKRVHAGLLFDDLDDIAFVGALEGLVSDESPDPTEPDAWSETG